MGQSARTDKLRCSKCCKRDWSRYERNRGTLRDQGITWHNVHVIGKTKSGEYVKIRCHNCGHKYSSRSSAAFRALEFWEKNQIASLLQNNQAYQHILEAKTKLSEAQDELKLALDQSTQGNSDLTAHYKADVILAMASVIDAKLKL